jgi:uncharacterized protein
VTKFAGRIVIILALLTSGTGLAVGQGPLARVSSYPAATRVIRLAVRGNVRAQAQLGWMYARGDGVPQDYVEAAKWYYRAACRGNGLAQLELGLMYNRGQGVPRDFVLAEMWLNLSAANAVGDNRDYIAELRDAVASKMTVEQLAAAQHLAQLWYRAQ